MSMARKAKKAPRAVGESTLAASLCRLVGVRTVETLDEARELAAEATALSLFSDVWMPYPWLVPVAAQVMAAKAEGVAAEALLTPGVPFLVKDSLARAGDDMFLVWAGLALYPMRGLPFRSLTNHFNVGGPYERVTAIQLKACLR